MIRPVLLVVVAALVAAVAGLPASADTTGWTLLGEQEVKGKRDRDTIVVGRYEGRFDQIQLVVMDSDIELDDLTVHFGNGERWSPALKHSFKEGQRSRAIDLPGNNRTIVKIDLVYRNTPGGGRAKVAIYGRDKAKAAPAPVQPGRPPAAPPMVPPAPAFDAKGWTLLGERTVDGRRDRDAIKVGAYDGRFDQLTMVVLDSDLELRDMKIVFGNRTKWSPPVKHVFKEGARTRVIDLPGKDRVIQRVELAYGNLPGGGKARVQLFARDAGRPAPALVPPPTWDNTGWTFLGKTTVDGWRDRDRMTVLRGQPFSEVMFVVGGSDVELRNITITFGNGEKFEMPSAVVFKEGTRTAPVDVPGKLRKIKFVDFAYANLPGGGRASVEVWGRIKTQAPPPATKPAQPPPPAPPGPPPATKPAQPAPPPPSKLPPPPVVNDHRKG